MSLTPEDLENSGFEFADPFNSDNYLESLGQWANATSDTELINEYSKLNDEQSENEIKVEHARQMLMMWEMSLKVVTEQLDQVVIEIENRGLFGESEGPERYYSSPGELW